MATAIRQAIKFRSTPKRLFDIYLSAKEHSAFTGCPTKVSAKIGSPFAAMDYISGRMLAIAPERQIIQTWRGSDWKKTDPDSVLILNFRKVVGGAEIEMIHAGCPDEHAKALADGWKQYYWLPLKGYLAENG
jgi:activator of HSP90 ATPase